MTNDDHLRRRFQNLNFSGEPPMASTTADDVRRGRRRLRRRRVTTWTASGAAVAALATGAVFAVPFGPGSDRALDYSNRGAEQEPFEVTDMTAEELLHAYDMCLGAAEDATSYDEDATTGETADEETTDDELGPDEPLDDEVSEDEFGDGDFYWVDWSQAEPSFGIRAGVPDAWANASWVVASEGRSHLILSLDGTGTTCSSAGTEMALADHEDDLLLAPVDQYSAGTGRYIWAVARVTVQPDGEPEQDAIMRAGFWFVPTQHENQADNDEGSELLNVLPGYVVRGYDESGRTVYDSSTDAPTHHDCLVAPDGELIPPWADEEHDDEPGASGEPDGSGELDDVQDPSDCAPLYEWGR